MYVLKNYANMRYACKYMFNLGSCTHAHMSTHSHACKYTHKHMRAHNYLYSFTLPH